MNEELNEAPFFSQVLRNTGAVFTSTVLTLSIAGMIFARLEPNLPQVCSLFTLAPFGFAYNAVMQIAGLSAIIAIISTFLFSERFFYKMRFFWRINLFLLMIMIVVSSFAVIFKWFPMNQPTVWIQFFIFTFVFSLISIGLSLSKLKLEGKKYNRLLESYKARHNIKQ
jgi:cation transporter-like permease